MPREAAKVSQIPVGSQFSADLVDLPALLQALVKHSGNDAALEAALGKAPVRVAAYTKPPTKRMRRLPLESAIQYGLLDPDTLVATPLTQQLAALAVPKVYEEFARHILLNLGGLRVLHGVEEMNAEGRNITGDTLAQHLSNGGFFVAEHNTAINTLRLWLARAGLFPANGRSADAWRPDPVVKERLLGMTSQTISALIALSPSQQAFALALARRAPGTSEDVLSSEVRDLAETASQIRIGRGSLPNEVLKPLQDAGLITYATKGTGGGKSSTLRVTAAFNATVLVPFLTETLPTLDPVAHAYFKQRPADIRKSLQSTNVYEAGQALEAFSVFLMRLLGLRITGWRQRAEQTGYGEVDVLAAGLMGSLPTSWQVQCKNTDQRVTLEDVAREVGLLPLTQASIILIVSRSGFTPDARRYATEIMKNNSVTIFLLGDKDFSEVLDRPESLGAILRAQGEAVARLKATGRVWRGGLDRR